MITRRQAITAAAAALIAPAAGVPKRAQAQGSSEVFILRIVGAAALRLDQTGYRVSLPWKHDHYAIAVVEKRYVPDPTLLDPAWKSAETIDPALDPIEKNLRLLHMGLGFPIGSYYRRPLPKLTSLSLTGASSPSSVERGTLVAPLARQYRELVGVSPTIDEDNWKALSGVEIVLKHGTLRTGSPSRPGLGDGLDWRLPVGWIFKKDPRGPLGDCLEFVVEGPSATGLAGIDLSNSTVWIVNGTTREASEPGKLEHGRLYWEYYKDTNPEKLPFPVLSADFLPSNRGGALLTPPVVELCYSAALDFEAPL